MKKSESKYFNTALLMNEALLILLEKKEFEYITIKELCEKAGVNRSTFYLHYENMNDLLFECVENILSDFFSTFNTPTSFYNDLDTANESDLIFIKEKYLTPFLTYFKNNKKVLVLFFKYADLVNAKKIYLDINEKVLNTVFKRFGVDKRTQHYMLTFHMNGIFAIVQEWLKNDCCDDIEYIQKIIIDCVMPNIKK